MERVVCEKHASLCFLKTGVKEGPNKGKSFYVCISRDQTPCDFTVPTELPPSHCLCHEDALVELQGLVQNASQSSYRLMYRCVKGKKEGAKWCGSIPWTEKDGETNHIHKKNPSSTLPPVRNPFKAPEKTDKTSEWKKLQAGTTNKGDATTLHKTADSERPKKVLDDDTHRKNETEYTLNPTTLGNTESKGSPVQSDSWRNKELPAGMKVKKRAADVEKLHSDTEVTITSTAENEGSHTCSDDKKEQQSNEKTKFNNSKGFATGTTKAKPAQQEELRGSSFEVTSTKVNPISQSANTDSPPKARDGSPTVSSDTLSSSVKPVTTDVPGTKMKTVNTPFGDWSDDDDDDVQLVSVHPVSQKTSSGAPVQKTITSYSGFQVTSKVKGQVEDPRTLHNQLAVQLKQKKATLSSVNVSALPDKGQRLKSQVKELEEALESLSLTGAAITESPKLADDQQMPKSSQSNPFNRPGGTILLAENPVPVHPTVSTNSMVLSLSQGYSQMYGVNPQNHAFYGGRMTEDRLIAVRNATTEVIDHLHHSLESCPSTETESEDPKGLKVQLMPHQRRALAWLLWREAQKPCGGILADDMGLGKTLTMIALILSQKKKDGKDSELQGWISKTDSSLMASQGTLIICPASLVHHWKKEIERHVKSSRLSIYLYHGPNRQRSSSILAEHDVVVTTYGLVSKEIPVQKEDAEQPSRDSGAVASDQSPLLRVAWARVILDEAHNIKNPKVQTSMAVCKLRAKARWAVTGTPIQNNLLDMYSLLKFLRCSPFDEYKLWKAQVDNGSKRGGERLNILTRSLLLRRTKDQLDSTGKPLVSLPSRSCIVHRVKLSQDEQSVYDVIFAQSRSTLQSYLKRHEEGGSKKGDSGNPFEKVAHEFGMSQRDVSTSQPSQVSSTIHILSLLLRLRQCCCHLSLLRKTLDQTELQDDGVTLSLEEQLCALSLSDFNDSDPKATVSLNGSQFQSKLFEESRESTKISSILTKLKEIRKKNQKSVIVSQWTSMLHIVAVHLKKLDLHFSVIDGTVNPKKRIDLVEEFNTNPNGSQVMLVSLCAGGVGINLTGGNHLFLIDMHWNPALEEQACDRIYRVGQLRDVTIHRFVCEGSVEDKISSLQVKKKELAQKVLSGTGSSFNKLSLADLRTIFGV